MTNRSSTAFLLTFATCLVAIPSRLAYADCPPGSWLCAEAQIGGTVQVGAPPPVIVVESAPPPPPPPPPPRVYVVQPAPAPIVVVQEAPPPPPTTTYVVRPRSDFGLHGHVGGVHGNGVDMGGMTAALRIRPQGYIAVDLGIGAYGGYDYYGFERIEVPLTADLLVFLNPRAEWQLYGLVGLGISAAHVEDPDSSYTRDMSYFGGQLGVGVEFRALYWLAFNADIRGFIRERVDSEGDIDDDGPEFVEVDGDGRPTGRTTDTSGGGMFTLGATIYF